MDNLVSILVAFLAAAAVGFIIYKIARKSGSSDSSKPGYTRPGKPNPDTDYR